MKWKNSNLQENRIGIETIPTNTFYNHKNPHRKLPIPKILNKPGLYYIYCYYLLNIFGTFSNLLFSGKKKKEV